jgi:hypothetical protein
MSILDYDSHTATDVSVTYADMPTGTEVLFVNQTSGAKFPSSGDPLTAGGSGQADIPIPSLAKGEYYLLAQEAGQYIAQTVPFYID